MEKIELTILRNFLINEQYSRKVLPFVKDEYFELRTEKIIFQDTYNAFKSCIIDFISRIGNKSNTYSEEELGLYVKLIETGI